MNSSELKISAVFATDSAGGLGWQQRMPWPRLRADLRHFQQLTAGQLVIMGSGTWQSADMPQPLPGRVNLVLSSQQLTMPVDHWCMQGSVQQVCERIAAHAQLRQLHCWVIGGAQVLQQWLPVCNQVWHTRVQGQWPADCWLPDELWQPAFELQQLTSHTEQQVSYDICQYVARNP